MSLASLKYVIGCQARPMTTLLYIKKNKCKSDYKTWGFQKANFQAYIIHCHGPTSFAVGEAKKGLSLQISRDHDREMPL
jgi:hypothetical protein